MCNLYTIEKGPDAVRRIFADLQVPLEFPEGVPNFQPRDVRISERAPIVKFDRDRGVAQLVERRWSWPAPSGKPVFNMRSDGREFSRDRCLVLADAFYEFTTPSDSRQKRKDCWRFHPPGDFAIAGLVREHADVGEAFTLLTAPPGPDIAPYHNRQIALLDPPHWRAWLDGWARSVDLLSPSVAGSLTAAIKAAASAE
ncbi:MAG: SOS response-associated peptidase family protein [Sphingomicrobium sp.]